MPDPTPTGPSPDALAIIAAQRELAATAEARADARQQAADQAAANRAASSDNSADRRQQERIAHELRMQAAGLAGMGSADRAILACMVAEMLPSAMDEAAIIARVRLGMRVLDALTGSDRIPGPAPVVPAPPAPGPMDPPLELNDAQAQTYATLFKSEFQPYPQFAGLAGAKKHWREWGRKEWLAGDPPRRRTFQP